MLNSPSTESKLASQGNTGELTTEGNSFFKKLIMTILGTGGMVFGATLLRNVAMPDLHQFCGAWG